MDKFVTLSGLTGIMTNWVKWCVINVTFNACRGWIWEDVAEFYDISPSWFHHCLWGVRAGVVANNKGIRWHDDRESWGYAPPLAWSKAWPNIKHKLNYCINGQACIRQQNSARGTWKVVGTTGWRTRVCIRYEKASIPWYWLRWVLLVIQLRFPALMLHIS